MTNEVLLIEKQENLAVLIFNRPEKKNSLSPELLVKLHLALEELRQDDNIRAIILRGVGDQSFSSGFDIGAISAEVDPKIKKIIQNKNPLDLALKSVIDYPYPVIAMLNGYAFGAGCEMAITCDIRVAADDIRMGMPPAKLGIVYSPEGLMRFINTIGLSAAKEIFFTGRFYNADRVKELGMVDYMVPRGELEDFTFSLAKEIAANAPLALKGTKRVLNLLLNSQKMSDEDKKEAGAIISETFASEDLKEAQKAFFEKRKPVFKGR